MQIAHSYGGINLTGWQFIGLPEFSGNWVTRNINNAQPIGVWHLTFTAIGALLMSLLTYVKARYVGFPIHPIGMTLGLTHPVNHVWFSVFLAWLFKYLILKYGGRTLHTPAAAFSWPCIGRIRISGFLA